VFFLLNIYSDEHQTAINYLRDIEFNINNVLIWTGDFNTRDNNWDPTFPHHSIHADTIREIADSLNLERSTPIHQVPTRYADNMNSADTVLDLMFLQSNDPGFNNYCILPEIRHPSDHAPLCVTVSINNEDINIKQRAIPKNSNEEADFVSKCTNEIKQVNTNNIQSRQALEDAVQAIASTF